ncbi:hypothetical protein [Leptospira bandrabouensis]|uniref:hypothetical protein n=1 Tax=Leptospira bandrabouensis TaxID=2484903 RepID=UPI001EE99201|nr:hypothetical protein [Leptospira bandrabouensis]MCG6146477.1 hypothetical protein [Leptospira bandrabouensis]MCG6161849.1 hypothetical protein [Leptospira bandrabouensis]MCG6166100.1 hypothetical protein [Leptospira bandrabouensis]
MIKSVLKSNLTMGIGLLLLSFQLIADENTIIDTYPYKDKYSSPESANSPYLECINESSTLKIYNGRWENRKKKEEGILLSHQKAGKVIQFYRNDKKIRISLRDDLIFNLTPLFSSETQDIYSINENNDTSVRFLYHFKPKNILILSDYSGIDVLGIASVTFKVDPFYCANTTAVK